MPSPEGAQDLRHVMRPPGQVDRQLYTRRIPGFCPPNLPCPIHTRYLLRSPNPPLGLCVHLLLTQPQERTIPLSFIHPFACSSLCLPLPSRLSQSVAAGQVPLPCATVCNLCVIGHISTKTLSPGPQVLILRKFYLYPGFLSRHHPCKQSFPVVSLETCRHPAP